MSDDFPSGWVSGEVAAAKDEKIDKLESWLTLADNALLALEQGDNEAAHERLSQISMERMDGGWSPFDYPVQIKALHAKLRACEAEMEIVKTDLDGLGIACPRCDEPVTGPKQRPFSGIEGLCAKCRREMVGDDGLATAVTAE